MTELNDNELQELPTRTWHLLSKLERRHKYDWWAIGPQEHDEWDLDYGGDIKAGPMPYEVAVLCEAAPDMARTLAGMHVRYAVQWSQVEESWFYIDGMDEPQVSWQSAYWHATKAAALVQSEQLLAEYEGKLRVVWRLMSNESTPLVEG